ncbi:hypothetical protein EYC84_006981 [Monilinia fructicola]|uniref:Uncharacterized protein n=1 Tax=Monilinia fructicola TaxID=38448 RepID=A0A5M9K5N8_MONFR|nr:hypothetical protein EYC84_006981 [Monilinia fructicola]
MLNRSLRAGLNADSTTPPAKAVEIPAYQASLELIVKLPGLSCSPASLKRWLTRSWSLSFSCSLSCSLIASSLICGVLNQKCDNGTSSKGCVCCLFARNLVR